MNYLVIRPKGDALSTISVHKDSDVLDTPFESWALNSGKSIVFVNNQLQKLLSNFYMFGTFDKGAVYAYEYLDLCKVIESKIGLSDRQRYESSCAKAPPAKSADSNERAEIAVNILSTAVFSMFSIIWSILKGLVVMVLIPLIIAFVGKRH